uniref:Uncharacterized protein n=1 Tax=Equus asinus TaxID=9793 RepID=A0A8C4L3P3_EQUAS
MHLEDTIPFCPKEEKESEQTSSRTNSPGKTRRGSGSSFHELCEQNPSGSEPGEAENLLVDSSPNRIS